MNNQQSQASRTAISFSAVTKQYGSVTAVNELTLDLAPGELFGFLGPNGAGKTTAIKMAAGLVRPTSGQILISGFDIQTKSLDAKRLFGFVPDNPYIYESLTGREFLHYCAGLYRLGYFKTEKRVSELSEQFGIGSWIDKRAGEYSHGMKQRIVMASAFLHEPEIVLIDEPMIGLDPAAVRMVKQVMKDFCSYGGTLFFSTHTLSNAEQICDRIGIINEGRLIVSGTMEQIRRDSSNLEDAFLTIIGGEGN
ncbi:ABC transporter ATP-binding protein [bacterium]|nr:ABC transporter ATP-binding protein [bacterium]